MTTIYKPSLRPVERVPGSPPEISAEDLVGAAQTYADVFAGPPWDEFTKCAVDGRFYGRDTAPGGPCPDGDGQLLVPAYPLDETAGYIKRELSRTDAVLFLLRGADKIVGFSWGFSYASPEEFAADKYRTPGMQQAIVKLLGASGVTDKFYYLSESGLLDDPAVRSRGISREFHARRLEEARSLRLPAVQRTSCQGPMYRTSLASGMTQIMGPEVIVDTQARTFSRTGRVINGATDTENEPRVLFVDTRGVA